MPKYVQKIDGGGSDPKQIQVSPTPSFGQTSWGLDPGETNSYGASS